MGVVIIVINLKIVAGNKNLDFKYFKKTYKENKNEKLSFYSINIR